MIRFLEAVLLLSGMIIGVGMFAIPFSFASAGFWAGTVTLALLSFVVLGLHLLYGEIVLATPGMHRMPGYTRHHLGRGMAAVSWASTLFGTIGTLLAYLIVGSLFLRTLFVGIAPSASAGWWATVLALLVAAVTLFPLKKEAAINGILTVFEIALLAGLSYMLLPYASPAHYTDVWPEYVFLPYGVLLFALTGASVIPEVATLLGRDKKKVRAAVVAGTVIPALLYFLFAYAVVGVSGMATSEEAIAGLRRVMGDGVVFWGSMAGLLAVLTSYVALSGNMQAMLALDMRLPRRMAWIAASLAPFILYLAGFQNFIAIISVVGILAFGVDGILFFFMGRHIRQRQGTWHTIPAAAGYVILAVVAVGVVAELVRLWR